MRLDNPDRGIPYISGSLRVHRQGKGDEEKIGGENCENVSERNSAKTQPLAGTESKKCQISPEATIPNHLDVSQRIGIEKSKSFGFAK